MAQVRHMLIALLAVIGLLTVPGTTAGAACPQSAPAAMPMMHHMQHGQPAPMNHEQQACPACLAVMPSLPPVAPFILSPLPLISGSFQSLAGIDPGLDPPPPRLG